MSTMKEIYQSRNILRSLVVKNLFGKYRNSFLGMFWHFITPLLMLAVYYIAFTEIKHNDMSDFWIYLTSGLFPFSYMLSNLIGGSTSITGNAGMIKKMYFPREILVLSQTISSFIVMLIGFCVVIVAILLSGHSIGYSILLFPIFLILMFIFVTGYVLLFSSITTYVRDMQYVLNALNMVFFFMTPMYFTVGSASGLLGIIIWINPFTYFIEVFHHILYWGTMPNESLIFATIVLSIGSVIVGSVVFNKLKKGFAEKL